MAILNDIMRTMGTALGNVMRVASGPINTATAYGAGLAAQMAGQYATSNLSRMGNSSSPSASGTVSQILNMVPGLSSQITRVNFSSSANPEVQAITKPMEYSGYVPDMTGGVPPQYIVTIQNASNWVVKAILQEGLSFSTSSKWEPFISPSFSESANMIGQLFHVSLVPRWASRRIWKGTEPLTIQLKLKFEAINNAWSEVVRPCKRLQQMVLPSTLQGKIPLIVPPGPWPFSFNDDIIKNYSASHIGAEFNTFFGVGDVIMIRIGRLIRFSNVIVSEVQVNMAPKLTVDGHPISSDVIITFQTYEIMTKDAMEDAYMSKG